MNNGNFKYILCTKMFLNADIKEVNEFIYLLLFQNQLIHLFLYHRFCSTKVSLKWLEDNSSSLKVRIVNELKDILDEYNQYCKQYWMVHQKVSENNVPMLHLRILGKRCYDGRRYNLPTTLEVVVLIVGDFDNAEFESDNIVETQSG